MSTISRSIAGATLDIYASWVDDAGISHTSGSKGSLIGPNAAIVALHAAVQVGKNGPIHAVLTAVTNDGQVIPISSTQWYVDLNEWNAKILAQGGNQSPREASGDIAVVRLDVPVGLGLGWLPTHDDPDNVKVPVTIYGGSHRVLLGGVLEDTSFMGDSYSAVSGVASLPGDSGGPVVDSAGRLVAVVSGGNPGMSVVIASDLSSERIAQIQGTVDTYNASLPDLAGREADYLARQLSPEWADVNLGQFIGHQDWASVASTVGNTIVGAVRELGPDVVVDFIANAFHISLSPAEHQYISAEMSAHPAALVGVLEQAMLPLMGAIPL